MKPNHPAPLPPPVPQAQGTPVWYNRKETKSMLLLTTETIPGQNFEVLGLVKGSTIQCKNIGRDIGSSFKNLVGGEMKSYVEMMNEARDIALDRMEKDAQTLGADAVVCMRFATSAIAQGAAEVMAYGTAVKFR